MDNGLCASACPGAEGEFCGGEGVMEVWVTGSKYKGIIKTRSYAALRAADLDWIVGPEYSLGGYIFGDSQLLRRRSL